MTSYTLNERIQIVIQYYQNEKSVTELNGDLDKFIIAEMLRLHSQSEDS